MMLPSNFAVWSFANIGMLVWGLAIAIPIAVHLWNRRTQHVMRWAAMEFLLAAAQKQSRRILLEQWILLAVRVAILGLLALALADPLLSGFSLPNLAPVSRPRRHTILVIDTSYSMAALSGEQLAGRQTLFELAKARAIDVVQRAQQGDGFTLLTLGSPPQTIIGDPAFEADDVVREIKAMTVSQRGADLVATIEEVGRVADYASRHHAGLTSSQVIIFSDLGRTSWDAATLPDLRQRLAGLAKKADLFLSEVGEITDDNVVIDGLTTSTPLAPVHRTMTFESVVRNYSLREQRRRVEFFVDGTGVTQQSLTVPAEGSSVATFSHRFDVPGQHVVESRIESDRLNLDNHRWLCVVTPKVIRVLCVEGATDAARFVALALAPDPGGSSDFQPRVISDHRLRDVELHDYDCVVLCNVTSLDDEVRRRLYKFVQAGGGLVTILGDRVQPRSYNESLAGDSPNQQLFPAVLGELVKGGPHPLDAMQYQHPLVAAFRGHERAGLLTLPIWRYFRLEPRPGTEIALAFVSGDPALTSRNIGHGRSIMLATAADADSLDRTTDPTVPWSALISWPSFPPMMHEIVKHSVAGRASQRNFLVGEPWDLASLIPGEGELLIDGPVGENQSAAPQSDPLAGQFASASGVYRIGRRDRSREPELVAVNLNALEGNLDRVAFADLPSQFRQDSETTNEMAGLDRGDDQPARLFRLLLGLAFLLMIVEPAFAWWLGARSRR